MKIMFIQICMEMIYLFYINQKENNRRTDKKIKKLLEEVQVGGTRFIIFVYNLENIAIHLYYFQKNIVVVIKYLPQLQVVNYIFYWKNYEEHQLPHQKKI